MMLVVTPIVPLPIFINRIVYLVWSILYFIKLLFEIIDCPRKFLFSMQIPVHCSEEIGFPLNCPTFPLSKPYCLFQTLSNFCLSRKSIFPNIFPLSNPSAFFKLFQTSASPERVFSKISSHFQTLLPISNFFKLLPLRKEYFPKYLSTFKPSHSTVLFSTMRF